MEIRRRVIGALILAGRLALPGLLDAKPKPDPAAPPGPPLADLPPPPEGRFKDNGDGTVTDRWEGLTWAKADGR